MTLLGNLLIIHLAWVTQFFFPGINPGQKAHAGSFVLVFKVIEPFATVACAFADIAIVMYSAFTTKSIWRLPVIDPSEPNRSYVKTTPFGTLRSGTDCFFHDALGRSFLSNHTVFRRSLYVLQNLLQLSCILNRAVSFESDMKALSLIRGTAALVTLICITIWGAYQALILPYNETWGGPYPIRVTPKLDRNSLSPPNFLSALQDAGFLMVSYNLITY